MANTIELLDPNFRPPAAKGGLSYREVREWGVSIHGLIERDGRFYRLPPDLCSGISEALCALNRHTSGGRIRLETDSRVIGIRAVLGEESRMPHMPLSGSSSIDVFAAGRYRATARPGDDLRRIEAEVPLGEGVKTVTLYLPLYNGIDRLELGLEPGASVRPAPPYRFPAPIVFYGSSITQGGCASRTANSYAAMAARALESDFVCLGFSGQAKGELALADYIAGLQMSALVYDYDHNAPDAAYLLRTHRPFLERILARQPRLPVLALTRPDPDGSEEDYGRRAAVLKTCEWAVSQRYDVQFVDGWLMFGADGRDCCTVDGCHPNDLGFYRMAQAVIPPLRQILRQGRE